MAVEAILDRSAYMVAAMVRTAVAVRMQSAGNQDSATGRIAVATASNVRFAGVRRAWNTGSPSVAIRVQPASFVCGADIGTVRILIPHTAEVASVPSRQSSAGTAKVLTVLAVRAHGFESHSSVQGVVAVTTGSDIKPRGFLKSGSFGRPGIAIAIAPDGVLHDSAIGQMRLIPAHAAKPAGVESGLQIGNPFVGFGLAVGPAGVGARARAFGHPDFAWRKCPRFDRMAVVARASELDARIRPAPARAGVWMGEARVQNACHVDAHIVRLLERRTVARLKNETCAAVRRKEQI